MRKKIELFGLRMKAAVQSHPVEVSLSVLACAMGCYDYESEGSFFDMLLQYMPVVFLFVLYLEQVLREDEETFVVLFLGVVMDSFFNDAGRAIFLFYASGFVDHCDTRLFGKWMDER